MIANFFFLPIIGKLAKNELAISSMVHLISLILLVFYFEISGNDINDEHPLNMHIISVILLVFHFEISGNEVNDEHRLII